MKKAFWTLAVLATGAALQFELSHMDMPVAFAQTGIVDAEVNTWSNELVRPFVRQQLESYRTAQQLIDRYNAEYANWITGNVIPNDGTLLEDGAGPDGDGRPAVTGAELITAVTRAQEIVAHMEGSGVLNTYLAVMNEQVN